MKKQSLTVVMYHYVRDLKHTRYPRIKGLDTEIFIRQINYLEQNYRLVTMEQVISAYQDNVPLPENAALLTFDDGYADHFTTVFPILKNRGIQGSFFAPVRAVTEHTVLDVNKIHFILASTEDVSKLLKETSRLLDKYRGAYSLDSYENYYTRLAAASRFDPAEVIFLKRLLQVELPLEVRQKITDELFTEIVGIDQGAFSRELYMSLEQMKLMVADGMHIGSHGFDHFWLGSLSKEAQEKEIKKSAEFIDSIGGNPHSRTICYPYGNYNRDTLCLLDKYEFKAGFTTRVAIADIASNPVYELPRIDTNDITKSMTK